MVITIPNNNIIVTEDGKRYKKADVGKELAGYILGSAVSTTVTNSVVKVFSKPFNNVLNGKSKAPLNDEFVNVIDTVLQSTGLDKKGIIVSNISNKKESIFQAGLEIIRALPKSINKACDNIPLLKTKIYNSILGTVFSISEGHNAMFSNRTNKIYVNKDKMSYAVFHEMGHAIIDRNKAGKALGKISKPSKLISALAVASVFFTRKKVNGERPKNKIDKAVTFIRDNAGKIALMAFIPELLNEGSASLLASKITKPFLSKANHTAMNKFNSKAFLTYIGTAIGTSAGIYLAKRVVDAISAPKEIKNKPVK